MVQLDTNALFTQYINVVNKAIGQHRDEFPYNMLIKGGQKLMGDRRVGVAVYAKDAATPHDYYTVSMEQDGKLDVVEHGKAAGGPDAEWKLPESHLRQVVDNPDPYIKQPGKLNLDWLKARFKGQA